MKTVLVVGAGRNQHRAIEETRARGLRVARRDGDRRGDVIAVANTPEKALERAGLAATRLDVEVAA